MPTNQPENIKTSKQASKSIKQKYKQRVKQKRKNTSRLKIVQYLQEALLLLCSQLSDNFKKTNRV